MSEARQDVSAALSRYGITISASAMVLWPTDFSNWYAMGTGGASSGAMPGRYKMKRPPAPENSPRMIGCLAIRFCLKTAPALAYSWNMLLLRANTSALATLLAVEAVRPAIGSM